MKKIFSLLVILAIIVLGCSKGEEPATTISTEVIKEIEVEEDVEVVEEEEIVSVRLCHDTDNGMVKWINGSEFGFYHKAKRFEFNDYCFDNNILVEYYCEDERPRNMTFVCKNECEDNHCL